MRVQKKRDWINTNQAIEIIVASDVHCTPTSLRTWINRYQLGKKVGGRWYIEEKRLREFLKGRIDGN